MTELEKAARQALEALEMALRYHGVMLLRSEEHTSELQSH